MFGEEEQYGQLDKDMPNSNSITWAWTVKSLNRQNILYNRFLLPGECRPCSINQTRSTEKIADKLRQINYWGLVELSCFSSDLDHLPPDWKPHLSSVEEKIPVECCKLPPAGAQRSWLSLLSPPPRSRTPSNWPPGAAAAPSSRLWWNRQKENHDVVVH